MKENEKDCQRRAVLFWYLSVKIKVCQAALLDTINKLIFEKLYEMTIEKPISKIY